MYTSEQITQIMQELGLSPQDANVRKVVEQLANSKPNVAIDQQFIAELRADLQKRSAIGNAQTTSNSNKINFLSMFMNKTLAGALIVLVVVLAGGVWYIQHTNKPLFQSQSGADQLLSGKYDVKSVAQESFGDLGKVAIVPASDAAKLNSPNAPAQAANMATSGMGGAMPINDLVPPTDKLIAPGEPYPGQQYYAFKYEGDKNLPGVQDSQPVLKRAKPDQPASLVSRIISMLSFGLIDLNKLTDVKLQNFSFQEDHKFGYDLYVDMQQGSVSMYQNYQQWPQPVYDCVDMGCALQTPTKITDLPSNADAIAAADQFLAQYSISKDGYGQPQVVEAWRVIYEQTPVAQRSGFYIPEQVQVVYPLMLEGKTVYDESGNIYGLNVMIDVKTKRVTNVSELISKQFESSAYTGETDTARILKIAESGGFRNYSYQPQVGKKIELDLDTPTLRMVKIFYTADNYKTNSDLYMPALVFPIKNWKEANYWRQTVIVPLVKSILDQDMQPQPVPLDLPKSTTNNGAAASPPSAGSAASDMQGE